VRFVDYLGARPNLMEIAPLMEVRLEPHLPVAST